MAVKDAYMEVLTDIINNGPAMFIGEYDARNDNTGFMYGISTLMEWIAYKTEDEDAINFIDEEFMKNMIKSKKKALKGLVK
ncbi:MAG: hypothetical protein E7167_01445 [Firmicutes bacterium]|nr:hypothetical protein [Bacillota bacterium]